MKLSQLEKNKSLREAINDDLSFENGIAFLTAGFTNHRHAKLLASHRQSLEEPHPIRNKINV